MSQAVGDGSLETSSKSFFSPAFALLPWLLLHSKETDNPGEDGGRKEVKTEK